MLRYIGNRLVIVVPLLFALTILLFFYIHALPGDPIAGMLGPNATPSLVEEIRHQRGLDRPLWVQYGGWLSGLVRGDLGSSLISGQSITAMVQGRIPATLQLTALSLVLMTLIGFPFGYLAGKHKGGWLDRVLTPASLVGLSLPQFWVGTIFILVFAVQLHWVPSGGYVPFAQDPVQSLRLTIMPALVLGITLSPLLARLVRVSTAQLQREPFMESARMRGLRPGTISRRYLLRNAVRPVTAVVGMQLGTLIGGQVVVEQLFNYPGLGRLLVEGATERDYFVVESLIFLVAVLYVVINLVMEIVHAWLDPRVRL
jgi:peptide/nickel transport system permease protein